MKVFVSGADGMLGSHIVRELIQRGHRVHALVHPSSRSKTLNGLDIERHLGDLLDHNTYLDALSQCEAVINAAASTAVWPGRNPLVMKVNLDGCRQLMKASQACGIKRFIQIGSANSFAPGSAAKPGNESNNYNGWTYRNDYMDSKYLAQKMLLEEHRASGFPVVVINPTYMIGAYDSGPSSGRLILSLIEGKVPAYSAGVKSYVHARDVAVAAVNAIQMGRSGECYIAAGQSMTYEAFFRKTCEVVEIPFRLRKIPFALVLVGGFFGSVYGRISGKAPGLSFGMARMSGMMQYYSAEKAIAELSMPQTPIDEAIRECVQWFRENDIKL